jgi:drug/metabolite transporter (DMT)-like permease
MAVITWCKLIVLSILWGGTFFAVAIALRAWPPLTLVLARVALAAAILIPIVFALGQRLPHHARVWCDFVVMAILNNMIPFALIFYGQTVVASGIASVINAATPLMTLLVARAIAGEPIAGHKLSGVVIGLAGVANLMAPSVMDLMQTRSGDAALALGMLACLGATLSYGVAGLWGRRFKDVPPIVSATSQLVCSTLLLAPVVFLVDRPWLLPAPATETLVAIVSLAVLSTALAYILFFDIMAKAGADNVMLVTLLIPASAIALGVSVLGERLAAHQIIGALVITASLLVIDGRLFGVKAAANKPSPATKR